MFTAALCCGCLQALSGSCTAPHMSNAINAATFTILFTLFTYTRCKTEKSFSSYMESKQQQVESNVPSDVQPASSHGLYCRMPRVRRLPVNSPRPITTSRLQTTGRRGSFGLTTHSLTTETIVLRDCGGHDVESNAPLIVICDSAITIVSTSRGSVRLTDRV